VAQNSKVAVHIDFNSDVTTTVNYVVFVSIEV